MNLTTWLASYRDLPAVGLSEAGQVDGVCKKVSGGRALFAQVLLNFSPADELIFDVEVSSPASVVEECRRNGWLESLWLGVLDTMLVAPLNPITRFRCVLSDVKIHPVDSSRPAFRLAGRYATKSLLERSRFVIL